MGLAIYSLYLVSPFTLGVSALVGVALAARRRAQAGRVWATHYRFQQWSFWGALGGGLAGGSWFGLGSLSTVAGGAGGDLALAGAGIGLASAGAFLAASVYGLTKITAGDPIGEMESRA